LDFSSFLERFFGLCNTAKAFQRMMDAMLSGLPFIFVYIDDILVASATREQPLKDLREVFERLAANGLLVTPSKCPFGQEKVSFLGHEVDANGVRPQTSKVDVVMKFPQPKTVKGLQGFLGMVYYYHRFILRAAWVMQPMYDLLKGSQHTMRWWTGLPRPRQLSPLPRPPCQALQFWCIHGWGQSSRSLSTRQTWLSVVRSSSVEIKFFSRKFDATQARYSVRQFRYYLEGSKFAMSQITSP
jgi:hypothetical protein